MKLQIKELNNLLLCILLVLAGCKSGNYYLQDTATVIAVNQKQGYVTLLWMCANPPYKLQPCFSYSDHPIYLFDRPELQQKVKLIKVK